MVFCLTFKLTQQQQQRQQGQQQQPYVFSLALKLQVIKGTEREGKRNERESSPCHWYKRKEKKRKRERKKTRHDLCLFVLSWCLGKDMAQPFRPAWSGPAPVTIKPFLSGNKANKPAGRVTGVSSVAEITPIRPVGDRKLNRLFTMRRKRSRKCVNSWSCMHAARCCCCWLTHLLLCALCVSRKKEKRKVGREKRMKSRTKREG